MSYLKGILALIALLLVAGLLASLFVMSGVIPSKITTITMPPTTLTFPTTLTVTTTMPVTLTSIVTKTYTATAATERTVISSIITTYTTTITPEFPRGRLEIIPYEASLEISTRASPDVFYVSIPVKNVGDALITFRYLNITGPGVEVTHYTVGLDSVYLRPGDGTYVPWSPGYYFYYYGPGDSRAPVSDKIWPINPVVNATYHVVLAYTDVYHLDETYLLELDLVAMRRD